MRYLHVSTKVERRIESLRYSGKAGSTLARKASDIIERLASGAHRHHMDAIRSYTRYGEKRIRNCRKYDLGCGYRLITLQRDWKVFVPFLGTHDECQRWLETNSRLKKITAGSGRLFEVPEEDQTATGPINGEAQALCPGADEEEQQQQLSDRQLRQVFSGLIEGAQKNR